MPTAREFICLPTTAPDRAQKNAPSAITIIAKFTNLNLCHPSPSVVIS